MFSKFKFKKGLALALSSLTLIGGVFNTNIQGVNAQTHDDFDTFETASYFNHAFDKFHGFELGVASLSDGSYDSEYSEPDLVYYAYPIYYDMNILDGLTSLYYSNDYFNVYLISPDGGINYIDIEILNYTGSEESFLFARLDALAIASYMNSQGQPSPIVSSIILTITSIVSGLLGGLGKGIGVLFIDLFTNGTGGLSSVAIWVIVLLGVSIALGAIAWVATLIRGRQR